jgi:hypothetical protein
MNIMRAKPFITAVGCLAIIGAAGFSIYRTQFAVAPYNKDLHRAVGRALAEQTAQVLTNSGKIVIVSIKPADCAELKTQMEEFEQTLQRFPRVRIKERYLLETDDKQKYSFGAGLSGRRYVRLVNKNLNADAIVSFVGAPRLDASELAELKKIPRLIAESRAPEKLKKPFEQKILDVAVASRFQFPAPVQGTPRSLQEWFEQRWQVITTNNAASLPSATDE